MNDKQLIFIGGLHRSGTSLLHSILRSHPAISGFANTGVPEDEGQHLQTVFRPAYEFGGPGSFGFNEDSYMDERHALATPESAKQLMQEWSEHWDVTKEYLIEKSPPNLVRTRFFQQLFPNCMFIIILRHPIAVAYATKKWSKSSIKTLIEHNLACYERVLNDIPLLSRAYVLRYEDFVLDPHRNIHELSKWIGIPKFELTHEVRTNVNEKYFYLWNSDLRNPFKKLFGKFSTISDEFEERANAVGYSIENPQELLPTNWLGSHSKR